MKQTMCSSTVFLVVVLALGLIGPTLSRSLLMADENDPPHQTHLTHASGTQLGDGSLPAIRIDDLVKDDPNGCTACHTASPGTRTNLKDPIEAACNICHSHSGAYDGLTHAPPGGSNNSKENMHSPAGATQSMIHNGDGRVQGHRKKAGVTCQDQLQTGTNLTDSFEEDPDSPDNFEPTSDQSMRVYLSSADSDGKYYGTAIRDFDPPLDLSGTDFFNFYVMAQSKSNVRYIKVKLRHSPSGDWSKCTSADVTAQNGLESNVWKLISLPRASFHNNTDSHWGSVDRIWIGIYDKKKRSYTTSVWLHETGCDFIHLWCWTWLCGCDS